MENPTPPAESQTTEQQQTQQQRADNNVVQLRVDEARAAMRAEVREIVELCALARHPELAAGFIGEGLKPDVVRVKLQEAQAADAAKRPIVAIDTSAAERHGSVISEARKAAATRLRAMSSAQPRE